jgi:hypothetical protein
MPLTNLKRGDRVRIKETGQTGPSSRFASTLDAAAAATTSWKW